METHLDRELEFEVSFAYETAGKREGSERSERLDAAKPSTGESNLVELSQRPVMDIELRVKRS